MDLVQILAEYHVLIDHGEARIGIGFARVARQAVAQRELLQGLVRQFGCDLRSAVHDHFAERVATQVDGLWQPLRDGLSHQRFAGGHQAGDDQDVGEEGRLQDFPIATNDLICMSSK